MSRVNCFDIYLAHFLGEARLYFRALNRSPTGLFSPSSRSELDPLLDED